MEIEISKTVEILEIALLLDPDGTPETVIRFVDKYGDIARQVRVSTLTDALECIRKQGE